MSQNHIVCKNMCDEAFFFISACDSIRGRSCGANVIEPPEGIGLLSKKEYWLDSFNLFECLNKMGIRDLQV